MTAEGYVRCWGSDAGGRATPTLAFAAAEQMESDAPAGAADQSAPAASGGHRINVNVPTSSKKREALSEEVDTSLRGR
jgi:hypothetical protein